MSRLPVLERLQCFCKWRWFVHSFAFDVHLRISPELRGVIFPNMFAFRRPNIRACVLHSQCQHSCKIRTLLPKLAGQYVEWTNSPLRFCRVLTTLCQISSPADIVTLSVDRGLKIRKKNERGVSETCSVSIFGFKVWGEHVLSRA